MNKEIEKIKSIIARDVWDFDGVLILNRQYSEDYARQLFREYVAEEKIDLDSFSDFTESIRRGLLVNSKFVGKDIKGYDDDYDNYQYWWGNEDDVDFKNNKRATKIWYVDLT